LVRGPGANGIVATSSIGEFVHLTREERWRCFEVCLDQAQKHPGLIAVAMTSGPTTNVFAVPACGRIAEGVKQGDLPRTVEIQSSGRLMR
jgi:hypothetical protein